LRRKSDTMPRNAREGELVAVDGKGRAYRLDAAPQTNAPEIEGLSSPHRPRPAFDTGEAARDEAADRVDGLNRKRRNGKRPSANRFEREPFPSR